MTEPRITSIRFSSGPVRRAPKIGDRRTTKKHGLQIRVPEVHSGRWVRANGRQCYVWSKPANLVGTSFSYLLQPGDLTCL